MIIATRCSFNAGCETFNRVFLLFRRGECSIPARDRLRLERLCRYAGRPAVATERPSGLPAGRLLYRLKRPWRDGTEAVVFEPEDFVAKPAALTPAPRAHLVRYHGVLAPAAAWRDQIVPEARTAEGPHPDEPVATDPGSKPAAVPRGRNYRWAELMKRVFRVDVLRCGSCGGEMKVLAAIHPPLAQRILDGLAPGVPGSAAALRTAASPESRANMHHVCG